MPGKRAKHVRKPPNDAILIIRIPKELREAVASNAALRGQPLSEAVRQALMLWLGVLAPDEPRDG